MSGIGGMVVTGMALGAGSEIGHQAVRGIMGSGSGSGHAEEQQQQQMNAPAQQQYAQQDVQQNPCFSFNQMFMNCLKSSSNDIQFCQPSMDQLMQCEKDNMRFYGAT